MTRRELLGLTTGAWAAMRYGRAQSGLPPFKLPPPFHSESVNNRPQVVSRPEGVQLRVPAGFTVEEYASGFERPRLMLLGPSGELILTDSVPKGSVWVLPNWKSPAPSSGWKKILTGLDRPYGLQIWKDYLYVGETTSIKRYPYNSRGMSAGQGQEIIPLKDFGQGHWTRSLLFDRRGEKLYVGIGSRSNVDAGDHPMRAAINRFNPDGSGQEIYASGTRNPIGMRWYPGSDTLWAAVQERDLIGDDLVPDYFTSIRQGGFYGWPYAYFGPNEDPRRKGENPELVKKTLVPDVALGAHVAVLDFTFYSGKQFPKRYASGAFLALHGSWNRAERTGYSVVFVPFSNGRPSGPPENFLTGWMLGPDRREVWGRPVAVIELPDGSLLVSEDGGNKIWRVSHKG
jgi:glucose/arabinose dehydrogenase